MSSIVEEAQTYVDTRDEESVQQTDIDEAYAQPQVDAWVEAQKQEREEAIAARKKVIAKLSEAFPPQAIKQRKGGNGMVLDYISGDTVIRRLNAATDMTWDFKIISHEFSDQIGGMVAHVRLIIPSLGEREHVGVQKLSERGGEDLFKGAVTDALKKAATLFNVGIDLYGDDLEAPPAPVEVRKHPRVRAGELLKEQGIKGKSAFDAAAQKRWGKNFPEVTEVEAQTWITELEKVASVPF